MAFSTAYYLIVFLPQSKKHSAENLVKCLEDEEQKHFKLVEVYAKMKREGKIDNLGALIDDSIKAYQIRKADCFKKYPQ